MDKNIDEYLKNTLKKYNDLLDDRVKESDSSLDFNDEFDKIIDNQQKIVPKIEITKDFDYSNIAEKKDKELLSLLDLSEDERADAISYFLTRIKEDVPELYDDICNIVRDSIIYDGEDVTFDCSFDYICVDSTIDCIRQAMYGLGSKEDCLNMIESVLQNREQEKDEFSYLSYYLSFHVDNDDQERLGDMIDALKYYYENGSQAEALDNMRKLAILVFEEGLTVKTTHDNSNYDPNSNTIFLNEVFGSRVVALHELGHAIDEYYHIRDLYEDNSDELDSLKEKIAGDPRSAEIILYCNQVLSDLEIKIRDAYENDLIERYGSLEEAQSKLIDNRICKALAEEDLEGLFDEYNVSEETRTKILDGIHDQTISSYEVSDTFFDIAERNFINEVLYQQEESMFLDIVGAIFGEEIVEINGIQIDLRFRHPKTYYEDDSTANMSEIIADMNALLVSDNQELLGYIKEIVGDEFYDSIIEERSRGRIDSVPINSSVRSIS